MRPRDLPCFFRTAWAPRSFMTRRDEVCSLATDLESDAAPSRAIMVERSRDQ